LAFNLRGQLDAADVAVKLRSTALLTSTAQGESYRRGWSRIELAVLHIFYQRENRSTAGQCNRGDNLSVHFHIQNSISLTIAVPRRII
jgi:hypothetical protein